MDKLKFLNNYDDLETIENIIDEFETLDPSEMEETKSDILKVITWSINTDDIQVLETVIKKLIDVSVVVLTKQELQQLYDKLEKIKDKHPENIKGIQRLLQDLDSQKWSGHIQKRRKLSNPKKASIKKPRRKI